MKLELSRIGAVVLVIPLNQAHLHCDPGTKLPLPRSEQENDDYHAAFLDLVETLSPSDSPTLPFPILPHTLFPLDLNDADADGIWLDSNGEAPVWENWAAGQPEAGHDLGYYYAGMHRHKYWTTSHESHNGQDKTFSVVCEYNPCINPSNCIVDQNLCNGPLSSVFTNDELMTCFDDVTNDIEVGSLVYTRKTITGIRSGQGSKLEISTQVYD